VMRLRRKSKQGSREQTRALRSPRDQERSSLANRGS